MTTFSHGYRPPHYTWPVPTSVTLYAKTPPQQVRLLRSYHYVRQSNMSWEEIVAQTFCVAPPLLLDSGAFSAAASGTEIALPDYGAYLLRQGGYAVAAANLDVIGDAKRTWKHQQTLETWGLSPLPVFHFGEPWRALERYVERYPYVALGGLVGRHSKALLPWLEQCFRRAQRTGTVFHGFGVTSPAVLRAFPFYSSDSSSWCSATRWGQLVLWDGEQAQTLSVGHDLRPADLAAPQRELLLAYGLSPELLGRRTLGQRRVWRRRVLAVGLLSMLRMAHDLRRVHGPQSAPGIPDPEGAGFHLYLAINTLKDIWMALLQLALWQTPYTQCLDLENADALDLA